MNYDQLYFLKDIAIVLLLFSLILLMRKIRELKETLAQEIRKRSMPLLAFEVNTGTDPGIFLLNDSYCYARDIKINPLDVVMDYGFKKHITLRFSEVEVLKPSMKVKLTYRIFDDDYEIEPKDAASILNHFSDTPVEMQLRYKNIDGAPFSAKICPEKDQYITKEVNPIKR